MRVFQMNAATVISRSFTRRNQAKSIQKLFERFHRRRVDPLMVSPANSLISSKNVFERNDSAVTARCSFAAGLSVKQAYTP